MSDRPSRPRSLDILSRLGMSALLALGVFTPTSLLVAPPVTAITSDLVFDGTTGASTRPTTMGGYTMTAFGDDADGHSRGDDATSVGSPAGPVGFSQTMRIDGALNLTGLWPNSYAGFVFVAPDSPQADLVMTLPDGVHAFYLYAQTNACGVYDITATTDDGTTSGPITEGVVCAEPAARFFGFYSGGGASEIATITVHHTASAYGIIVGEFGLSTEDLATTAEVATQVSATSIYPDQTVDDVATVTGNTTTDPTGTVQFYVCYDDTATPDCDDGGGTAIGSPVDLDPGTADDGIATATLSDYAPESGVGYYAFYAAYSGDSTYDAAGDEGTNEAFVVVKRTAGLTYTGPLYYAPGSTSMAFAVTMSPTQCTGDVDFYQDADFNGTYETFLGTRTLASALASLTKSSPAAGLYEVKAVFDATSVCTEASTTATIVVAGAGDSANGGGFFTLNGVGRVGFGFVAHGKTLKGVTTWSGNLLWATSETRFKGSVTSYVQFTCPTGITGTCGYFTGTGTLFAWDEDTLEWVPDETDVVFQVRASDGGSATVCTKKVCGTTTRPDSFGMTFPNDVVLGESAMTVLKGGNIWIK